MLLYRATRLKPKYTVQYKHYTHIDLQHAMSKSTKLTHSQWDQLYAKLKQDYPLSTVIIRDKMQRVLGFLNRDYHRFNPSTHKYEDCVYLDWYDESKRTMFYLRYSEYITLDTQRK